MPFTHPPIERLSHDKAKAALFAIAARSPHLVSTNEVADLLGDIAAPKARKK